MPTMQSAIGIERERKLVQLANKLGYEFGDLSFLQRALTHRSAGSKNNERLEFLGDSLVNFMVADVLFHQFTKLAEGDMSRIRAHLVKGDTLGAIAQKYYGKASQYMKIFEANRDILDDPGDLAGDALLLVARARLLRRMV